MFYLRSAVVKSCLLIWLLLSMVVFGCSKKSPSSVEAVRPTKTKISVAAASDLTYALPVLCASFEKEYPELEIASTFGSSGSLYAQLSQEAPFDLFLSADASYPVRLIEQGIGGEGSVFAYAVGHLVLWVRNDSALDLSKGGLTQLEDSAIRKIAIANPKHAPYGRAAEQALRRAGVYDQVEAKVVIGENVSQTFQFVESGTADVGLVALSLAQSQAAQASGRYWPIPSELHEPLVQKGVLIRKSSNTLGAEKFRDFLLTSKGQAILQGFGFSSPGED